MSKYIERCDEFTILHSCSAPTVPAFDSRVGWPALKVVEEVIKRLEDNLMTVKVLAENRMRLPSTKCTVGVVLLLAGIGCNFFGVRPPGSEDEG